ncbi:MAG: fibronectin type III domain-containing protein [Gammaproteobacteria bacterium]|nr:fibronectin type III domain-containing protein [Gammaproteobacteria bacterium]
MKGRYRSGIIRAAATLTMLSFLLNGCGMGDEEPAADEEVDKLHELTGSVGDGPIVGASLRILRNDKVELSQIESGPTASFNVTVRTKGKYYPLSIEATNGIDLVTNSGPDFKLLGAVLEPGKKSIANVNPFSTFTVELARHLPGGPDKTNLQTAQAIVSSEFNNGLTTLAASGSMNTKIDSSNIAEIVRASEALGETVRRTRDALNASGYATSGNDVVRVLAADLADSVIDGLGGSGSDARFAAVWNIVSAQVLLETMANELHVNGGDATQLMNDAITAVSVGRASPALADLTVTAEMIERARVGLAAAHAVTSDSSIVDLLGAIDGIQTGSGSTTVRNYTLPGDYRSRLDNSILLVAGGDTTTLETVNDISRQRTKTTVTGPGLSSVALSWVATTHNEDGSACTDLAGYKIYWGTTPGSYPNSVTINDPDATTYVVDNLSPGTYEFVATAFNTSDVESAYSSPATKVVQ